MADWLSAACRRGGYATVWLQPSRPARVQGAVALVWDGGDFCVQRQAQLPRLKAELGPLPILALLDFPRVADHDAAVAAGVAAVLSKPLLIDDLLWSLQAFFLPLAAPPL
jgi:CheY-like chemotaxis protein